MKAILIAAGMGARMGALTKDLPKCLAIQLDGRPLLDIQLETLRAAGVDDIVMIVGYQGEKVNPPGVRKVWNHDFQKNNILESLFKAKEELNEDVIISYSDIWFDQAIPKTLIETPGDILLAVDVDWKKQYVGRKNHPLEEAEVVTMTDQKTVKKIGKLYPEIEPDAEFIGMLKLNSTGLKKFVNAYEDARGKYFGQPFQKAATFEKSYLTDLFQYMTDNNEAISCQPFHGLWREMDTIEDRDRWIESMKTSSKENPS